MGANENVQEMWYYYNVVKVVMQYFCGEKYHARNVFCSPLNKFIKMFNADYGALGEEYSLKCHYIFEDGGKVSQI